jgi:pyrimidine operon attenuation protein/uracil phosphoribosyltransferase
MERRTIAVKESKVLMTSEQMNAALKNLADQIIEEFPTAERLALLGIRTRGAVLAERLQGILEERYGAPVGLGILDITFYRDDLSRLGPNPMVRGSDLPFDLQDAYVVLVDDVMYTGRTVRAALDEISDFGRPSLVRLAIVVDRGLRELPLHPDYCALSIQTTETQRVRVMVEEMDDEDGVALDDLEITE